MRCLYYSLLASLALLVSAQSRDQCYLKLVDGAFFQKAVALDNAGNRVANFSDATAITYESCMANCPEYRTLWGVIKWSQFFAQISGWLVPWLALLSQLPYGATLNSDNATSLLLALGSPALAVYSLTFTSLNQRYLARCLSRIKYENIDRAYIILDKLQQAPLCVDTDESHPKRLNILPQDGQLWDRLRERTLDVHTWTTIAIFQMAWVVLATGLSIATTFLDATASPGSELKSSGSDASILFLWLIPVVMGWLQVSPISDHNRLRDATQELTFAAATDGFTSSGDIVPYPAIFLDYSNTPALHDMQATPPIFNYSRFTSWSRCVNLSIVSLRRAVQNVQPRPLSTGSHSWGYDWEEIGAEDERGALGRAEKPRVDSNFARRLIFASVLALSVQWGTSGAAILANVFSPPRGLACHAGPWLLYACNSTIIWFTMALSAIIDHAATIRILRVAGKTLASVNALFVIGMSLLNSLNIGRTCYCGSGRLYLGHRAYFVFVLTKHDVDSVSAAWTGAVVMAVVTVLIFGFIQGMILRDTAHLKAAMVRNGLRSAENSGTSPARTRPFTNTDATAQRSANDSEYIPLRAFNTI